jgi:hypothetical protein
MESDQIYEQIQESKIAFAIALLVAIYCFSVIRESIAVHLEWKVICSGIGFLIVAAITAGLFIRLLKLQKASKNILDDSK